MKLQVVIAAIVASMYHSVNGFSSVVPPVSRHSSSSSSSSSIAPNSQLVVKRDATFTSLYALSNDDNDNNNVVSRSIESFTKSLAVTFMSMFLMWNTAIGGVSDNSMITFTPPSAYAAESTVVGEFKTSGLVFKDTLIIERFNDPKVKGVTLYVSNFQRPITEKLSGKNFFNDPSSASVGCARTGEQISIADNIAKGVEGEEVFKESRSLLFKSLKVQRIYDEESKTVVYVSYSARLDKNDDSNKARFQSNICAVSLD